MNRTPIEEFWWFVHPTTVWFRATIRDHIIDPFQLLMAVVTFRMFNKIETGEKLQRMMLQNGYERGQFLRALGGRKRLYNGHLPMGIQHRTLAAVVAALDAFQERDDLHVQLEANSLQRAYTALCEAKGIGPALAYEIVCDLRHTQWLLLAEDTQTWGAPTAHACGGVGALLGTEVRPSRAAGRKRTVDWIRQLCRVDESWEASEAHRALCLFYYWKRPETPPRRYRWK
jgi:hypothetical protein